ncbi:MAG: putative spermidine/putrescine transport system permease protein [Thermoleophilaceae bacterium]|nr:putative spermidine/putrescine transport system permease protein [Thermoleophilaceae bacterium]
MARKLLWVVAAIVGVVSVAPALIVIPYAFSESGFLDFPPGWGGWQWFQEVLDDPTWGAAAMRSLQVALIATGVATVLGTAAAYALVRARPRFSGMIVGLLVLPMVVPIIIFALGSFALGSDLGLVGSIWTLALAHAALALPFVLLNVRASLQLVDSSLEQAARSLGAGPLSAFGRVTLPLILPGVVSGAVLAFVLSFDEPVVALFLSQDTDPTLPVKLFQTIRLALEPTVAAVSVMLLLLGLAGAAIWWIAMRLGQRRLRAAAASVPEGV